MAFYHRSGEIPPKRHTQFRKADGALYSEQVMGTKGFSGIQSILYHLHPPMQIKRFSRLKNWIQPIEWGAPHRHRHLLTFDATAGGDFITGRKQWLINKDLVISTVSPMESMAYFFRNGDGYELIFVHEGEGVLESVFGNIPYTHGDYLVIPVGTTYKIKHSSGTQRFLIIESMDEITSPKRYRNEFGQLMEHSPYCERDIRLPEFASPYDELGEFEVRVKVKNELHSYIFVTHPFDVVGWDGFLYPWAFNIYDFEPITGSIHQPPPIHQTFSGQGFVVCSFVPRMYDYHPLAVPAPYFHSNVESDEVLYYVRGNFMSRRGVKEGSITFHPVGLTHGPHPGKVENSIGKSRTEELAVMIDTFKPLYVAKAASHIEDDNYPLSWLQKGEGQSDN